MSLHSRRQETQPIEISIQLPLTQEIDDVIILRVLGMCKRPVTYSYLAAMTGLNKRTIQRRIENLLQLQKVKRQGRGRRWGYLYELV